MAKKIQKVAKKPVKVKSTVLVAHGEVVIQPKKTPPGYGIEGQIVY